MNYPFYVTLLIFLAAQSLFCAQKSIVPPNYYTFLSDEKSPSAFVIPGQLAMRCQKIVSMFEDFEDTPYTPDTLKEIVQKSCAADVSRFTSYLQMIDIVNRSTTEDNPEELNKVLFQHIRRLSTPDLINLFKTVDIMNVVDKNDHDQLAQVVADKIKNPKLVKKYLDLFEELNNRGLFRNVVQLVTKNLKFEEDFLQSYANALTGQYSLERTISIPKIFYNNVCNALKAPFRSWGYQWAKKNSIRPCYLNTQTGTIITGFTEQLKDTNKIVQLLITKKNPQQAITISLKAANIDKLIEVEANKTESSFICRSKGKTVVINISDPENPTVIDEDFIDCVFSDNNDELYVIKKKDFCIFNMKTKTFASPFDFPKNILRFQHIKTNKNSTIIALCSKHETYDDDGFAIYDCISILAKKDGQFSRIGPTRLKSFDVVDNMCVHPCQEKIYFNCHSFGKDARSLFCIDLNEKDKKIDLMETDDKTTCLQFLTDNILFVGHATKDNTFFNTKTNRPWSKKKPDNDRIIFFKNKPDDYTPLMITADGKWLVEEKRENNMLIDLFIACNSQSSDHNSILDFSTKKIAATQLIDDAMITAIEKVSGGFLPLSVLTKVIRTKPKEDSLRLWRWMRDIALCVASCTAIILKPSGYTDTKPNPKRACAALVAMAAMATILLERSFAQY